MPRIPRELRALYELGRDTVNAWIEDRAPRKGAALAFYTVFSLAPLLIISISIAGLAFGEEAARGEIVTEAQGLIGRAGARAIEALILNADRTGSGWLGALIGFATLLIGATTVLAELKDGLDQIWRVPIEPRRGFWQGFWYLVRNRVVSISMILAIGFLLLVSLLLNAAFTALARYWSSFEVAASLLNGLNTLISLGLVTALFAMIYKLVPNVHLAWRDVIVGALVTAVLFTLGKSLIGFYLGNSAIASTYGAAGSIVLVLLWVYYSALIFLLGAEFTRLYTYRYGSRRGWPLHSSSTS